MLFQDYRATAGNPPSFSTSLRSALPAVGPGAARLAVRATGPRRHTAPYVGALAGVLLLAGTGSSQAATPQPLRVTHGAVASDHASASEAGAQILRSGGNAIDAACATALALGVTIPHSSGIGGGGFALVYIAKEKKTYALDFRETAPAAARTALFLENGEVKGERARRGGLAVAIPGEVRGLATLVKRWGRLPFSACVAPAERLARGAPASARVAWIVNGPLAGQPFLQQVFRFRPPLLPGTLLRRPALAKTLSRLRRQGPEAFYKGAIARDIVLTVQKAGGVMTLADLANYKVAEREPLSFGYRGHRILAMPPPSSGGLVIATALGILERVVPEPQRLGPLSSDYLHVLSEALKHGFADRARHMGDPGFVDVPVEKLMSPAYHDELAKRVGAVTVAQARYGTPGPEEAPVEDGGTAHLSVIDRFGNAVSLTTTVNHWFGARLVTAQTGIVLNNEMDDFSIKPGVENGFRLVGTDKNAIAPGKRPLSSMSPTLVLDEEGVKMAVGGAGGPTIISGTLQVLLNVIDFGFNAQQASAAPRIHHQWKPPLLFHEPELVSDVRRALQERGHELRERKAITKVNVVVKTTKGLEAASEFRSSGAPAGH